MPCLSVLAVLHYAAFMPKCSNCLDALTGACSPLPWFSFLYSGKRTETFGRYLFRAAAFLPVGERRHVSV